MHSGAFKCHLCEEDAAHESDQQKSRFFENGKFFDQPNAHARQKPQREDSDEHPSANDPKAFVEGHGGDHIVQAQRQVHDLDLKNRRYQARSVVVRLRHIGSLLLAYDIRRHEPDEVGRTEDF